MELVKPVGRRKGYVRRDALVQLSDVGDRLEYVLARYARIVGEFGDSAAAVPDLAGRVELINSQLVFVAQRLQELLLAEHELARADAQANRESGAARRHDFPRQVRALA